MLDTISRLYLLFSSHNYQLYEVGGCVRDMLMGKDPHDYDFAADALPQEMLALGNDDIRVIDTGSQYGTVTFHVGNDLFEVTTFRHDCEYSDGRRPDSVTFSNNIYEDLSRRDFTVNAIAVNLYDNSFIDPYKGREDIKNKIIRTVGIPEERFREDGLRILRAIRFKFKLEFGIEENTCKAILNNWNLLDHVSQERITSEFLQILDYCNISSQQDALLMDGLINYILPEAWCENDYDNNFWRYEVISSFSDTECKLAYLLRGSKSGAENTCKRLKLSNDFTKDVCDTLKAFEYIVELDTNLSDIAITQKSIAERDAFIARKLVAKYGTKNSLRAFEIFAYEYGLNSQDYYNLYDIIKEAANKYPVALKDLTVKGEDLLQLGYEGVQIGKVLNDLLELVLLRPECNNKEFLLRHI